MAEPLPHPGSEAQGLGYMVLVPDEAWVAPLISYLRSEEVRTWLDHQPAFAALYAQARRHQAEALIEAAIDTAHEALGHDNAAAVRVKIDAMLKLAAQLNAPAQTPGSEPGGAADETLAKAILAARARLARTRPE